jgi:hypothetical protein
LLSPESAKRQLALLQPKLVEADRILALRREFDLRVSGLVDKAKGTEDPIQVGIIRAELDAIPIPYEYPDGGPKKAEGLSAIDQRLVALDIEKKGEDTRQAYHSCMISHNFAGAAELLSNKERESPAVVATLRSDFQNRWDTVLIAEVQSQSEGEHWPLALRALDDFENSREAVSLTGASGRIRRDELRRRVETHRTESVYSNWYNDRRNLSKVQDVMQYGAANDRVQVQNWRKFDEFSQLPQIWEITMEEIYLSDFGAFGSVSTRTDCSRDGTSICSARWTFDTRPETAKPDKKGSTNAKLSEKMNLSLTYTTLDLIYYSNFTGRGSWSGTPQELIGGVEVTITNPPKWSDPRVKLRAKLKYGDIPALPELRVPRGGQF